MINFLFYVQYIKANNEAYSSDFQISYASLVIDLEKLNKDLSEYLNGVEGFTNSGEDGNEGGQASSTSRGGLGESGSEESEHETISNSQSSSHQHGTQMDTTTINKVSSKEVCLRESVELVSRLNNENGGKLPTSGRTVDLIVRLTSLLFQVKGLMHANANLIEQRLENVREEGDNQEEIENNAASRKQHHFMPFSTKQLTESLNEIKNGLGSNESVKHFEDKVLVHINHIESRLCHYNKLNAFKST